MEKKKINTLSCIVNITKYNRLIFLTWFGYKIVNISKNYYIKILNKAINLLNISFINYSLWGTYNRIINNIIKGLNNLYVVKIELRGVGFRGEIKLNNGNQVLIINIGYSHSLFIRFPKQILIFSVLNKFKKNTNFILIGIDKQKINEIAKQIILLKKCNLYKGKGIFFENENLILKISKRQNVR